MESQRKMTEERQGTTPGVRLRESEVVRHTES